jgi:hypothetical protein
MLHDCMVIRDDDGSTAGSLSKHRFWLADCLLQGVFNGRFPHNGQKRPGAQSGP